MHLACAQPSVSEPPHEQPLPTRLSAADVHKRYSKLVWKTIHRLGIRGPHLDDVHQEVFLVVHRRLDSFEGQAALTTWLFEVCFRVVAGYRRRAHFRREHLVPDMASVTALAPPSCSPEREFEKREAAARVERTLSRLKLDQRVVFRLFELEGLTCTEISEQVGIPVGTVYSRLHRARHTFVERLG
jgi:RNA polymerase sigma-70 factor (ECF subfamily)